MGGGWGSNCLSYVHVNYRESERAREKEEKEKVNKSTMEDDTKEAQVFSLSKQVKRVKLQPRSTNHFTV